jgi:3-methyladenine DNA glycosylase AlkD
MTVKAALAALKRAGSKKHRDAYARFGIVAGKAFGVPMGAIHRIAKDLGRDHALAAALWKTGWYEARLLAAFVGDPAQITPAQMDGWCRQFDNWAVCDTACSHLFDKSPHAWRMVDRWSRRKPEFKAVSWALQGMGHRNSKLHAACVELASRLSKSAHPAERWVGKDALRDLERPFVRKKLEARARRGKAG